MGFEGLVLKLKRILEVIEKEAPQDRFGELQYPFRLWAGRLRKDIKTAEEWAKKNMPEETEGKESDARA